MAKSETTAKTSAKKAPPPPPAKAAAKGAKAPVKAAKPAAPVTVTLKHISAEIAEKHDMQRRQAETLLNDVFVQLVDHLKAGERVRVAGLGIIEVKDRPARMGRNPATGAAIEIKASRKIAFRAAKELKEAI